MKPKRTWGRFVGDLAIAIDHIETIRPACVRSLRSVVEGVDYRGKCDPEFYNAYLPHLPALLEILWARKHHLVVQIVGVLPDVARVRLADIYDIESDAIFVLLVKLIEGSNLPPKRWSSVASEDEDNGLLPSHRR